MPPPETSVFVPGAAGGYSEAAVATPIAGSVTQSSDTAAGVTANAVHATVALDDKGLLTAAVTGVGWQLQSTTGETFILESDWARAGYLWTMQPYRSAVVYTDRRRPQERVVRNGDVWTPSGDYSVDELGQELYGGALGELNGERGILFYAQASGGGSRPVVDSPDDDGSSTLGTDNEVVLSEIGWLDHRSLRFVSESDAQSPPEDPDYLILGFWSYVPDHLLDEEGDFVVDEDNLGVYRETEYGVFVDGNDPFDQENIGPLTGKASYRGLAMAYYYDTNIDPVTGTGKLTGLSADVSLTADFGNGAGNGTIGGKIANFLLYNEYGSSDYYDPTELTKFPASLVLENAPIGDSHGGFFTGNTSMTFDGSSFAGKWGGQFYGNRETDRKPGSAAGTFGAATTDGSKTIIGAFGTYKD